MCMRLVKIHLLKINHNYIDQPTCAPPSRSHHYLIIIKSCMNSSQSPLKSSADRLS